MNNSEKPIYPTDSTVINTHEFLEYNIREGRHYSGLTKREYFAAMAMQGILSACPEHGPMSEMRVASYAIEYADELLKQLEK